MWFRKPRKDVDVVESRSVSDGVDVLKYDVYVKGVYIQSFSTKRDATVFAKNQEIVL